MKNSALNLLSLVLVLSCGLPPSHFARAQCLSVKDDLSIATDTDLSGIQDFSIDLFKQVIPRNPKKNFVFSPYSIWNALVTVYFGSAGETQRQFENVLHVKDKISTLRKWRQLEYLYKMRPETSVNNTFVLSNRAYFDDTVALRYCMEDILHNEVRKLDFLNDAHGSAEKINLFVKETTEGHITKLVSSQDVMFALMVLVNAAYFRGFWATTFDPEDTRILPFETFGGQKVNVPMMSQYGRFRYGYNDAMKTEILELPYTGGVISMYLFLPYRNNIETFDYVVSNMSFSKLEGMIKDMFETQMHVFLPKFSLQTLIEHDLIKALHEMGLKDAFVKGKANFLDFSLNPNIKLDRGIHKAFIDVNEEGTEAGAATAFIANKIGGNSHFNCNRSFIFAIRDNGKKNLLFMGAVKDPSPTEAYEPSPVPVPAPSPVPVPVPEPSPVPVPVPAPFPGPVPVPVPAQFPGLVPVPGPVPSPSPFPLTPELFPSTVLFQRDRQFRLGSLGVKG